MKNSNFIPSPAFRYIGGKTWLKEDLNKSLKKILTKNHKINSYVEPFAGGLGSFLAVSETLKENNVKNIFLNDLNLSIISVYNNIIHNKKLLIECFSDIEEEMKLLIPLKAFSLDRTKDKEEMKKCLEKCYLFFLEKRKKFNEIKNIDTIELSALLLFLQNHCFNGIYRENASGNYNTSFNWDIKRYELIVEKIEKLHDFFINFNINFTNSCFSELDIEENMLIYADPPYINLDSKNENKYSKNSFSFIKQIQLIEKISGNNFIYSNYNHPKIISSFNDLLGKSGYVKKIIKRKNIISCDPESRDTIKEEILIYSKK